MARMGKRRILKEEVERVLPPAFVNLGFKKHPGRLASFGEWRRGSRSYACNLAKQLENGRVQLVDVNVGLDESDKLIDVTLLKLNHLVATIEATVRTFDIQSANDVRYKSLAPIANRSHTIRYCRKRG